MIDKGKTVYKMENGHACWRHELRNNATNSWPARTWCGIEVEVAYNFEGLTFCNNCWHSSDKPAQCTACLAHWFVTDSKENNMNGISYKITGIVNGKEVEECIFVNSVDMGAIRRGVLTVLPLYDRIREFQKRVVTGADKPKRYQIWVSDPGINQTAKMVSSHDDFMAATAAGRSLNPGLWVTIHDSKEGTWYHGYTSGYSCAKRLFVAM